MPFTVEDFQDLLKLLEQRPDWQAELRRRVLSDELLELPGLVRQLAEAQARTAGQLGEVASALAVLSQRMDTLASRVDTLATQMESLASRVDTLASRVQNLADQISTLAEQISTLAGHVGEFRGTALEWQYVRHYPAYFGRLARRLRLVEPSRLADLLDDAIDRQELTEEDRTSALAADLVLTGRRRTDQAEVYLAVEVSVGIGTGDVSRAAERARILEKLGRPALPVVAGQWINPEASEMARAIGVWSVLDGRTSAPPDGSAA